MRLLDLRPGDRVLDACGGTAELARLAARQAGPGGQVIVCDFSPPMMAAGIKKLGSGGEGRVISFVRGDVEDLSFLDEAFDVVMIGFGLRNLPHPRKALAGFFRVLKPWGKLMVLEFSVPANRPLRALHYLYSFYWMPLAAGLVTGTAEPYRYLARSIRAFPPPEDMAERIALSGFIGVRFERLSSGIAVVHLALKPGCRAGGQGGPVGKTS